MDLKMELPSIKAEIRAFKEQAEREAAEKEAQS